jgi:hypothetical protein
MSLFQTRAAAVTTYGLFSLCVMGVLAWFPAQAADPETKSGEHIIWDEPPGNSAPAAAAPAATAPASGGAPIRDSYATSASSSAAEHGVAMSPRSTGQGGPCREFQQQIVIEGRHQLAHGTACRQPDGSWRITN